jgi:glycosyltransferase involved in cell wall biosynthesis
MSPGPDAAGRARRRTSRVVAVVDPRFPTLAEQLSRHSAAPRDAPGGLVVVVVGEGADGDALPLPDDSVVLTVAAGGATTLANVREAVAERPRDLLLLSGDAVPSESLLVGLRRALDADASCATVSIDPDAPSPSPGVPPRAVGRPRPGAVLVRRDHLLLALDEDPLGAARADGSPEPARGDELVEDVLARLERPGFVHRAFAAAGAEETPRRASTEGRARGRGAAGVVFDGRSFAYTLSGTQVQTIGLLGGLVRAGADVTVALTAELHPTVRAELGELVDALRFVEHSRVGRVALVHKPHQFWSLHDLAESLAMGERVVLTQLDMILERTPAYRRNRAKWVEQCETTAAALASVDQIGFLSTAAALDAASDGDLELDRATVVYCGVDHLSGRPVPDPARPLGARPYLLVVGNAYWHKNRTFALRLLRWLVDRHGWDGGLVLAGGHPDDGASLEAEAALRSASPPLAGRVEDLRHVSEQELLGLYAGAELTLFPSYYEGFGFVPFESAALGTACVYTSTSAMKELLPKAGALPSWALEEAGPFVAAILESAERRREIVEAIGAAASGLTWDNTAAGYLEVYERALAREPRPVSRRLLDLIPGPERRLRADAEVLLVDVYRRRRGFRVAADAVVGAGQVAARGARRVRRLGREA